MMSPTVYKNEYIPQGNLHYLKLYKYRSEDKSPVSKYILNHYWNYVVSFVPLWVAPNLLTLMGSVNILFSFVLNIIYAPSLNEIMPSWVYIVQGSCLWIYMTLDAIDGKQARRTGQSGPLGELFDHGCDSLTAGLALIIQATSLLYGSTWKSAILVFMGLIVFYTSTLEEYHTGPKVWLVPFVEYYPSLVPYTGGFQFLLNLNFSDSIILFLFIALFPTCFASYKNIIKSKIKNKLPIAPAFIDFIPLIVYLTTNATWLYLSPALLTSHFILFFSYVNFGFSYIVGRVIVAHVSQAKFPSLNRMHIPALVGLFNSMLSPVFGIPGLSGQNEVYLVYACLIFSLLQYFHFAFSVIDVICSYLDINCLTIKHKKKV
ncbi:putative CDP-alcohol phosphatidyltransferase class-I family protein 3 [Smittium mucronatum]|uniref:Putative CDP-alcohol phosphatidyltransferase class-I family protein 3 n=1 Tax=Smittium mucronatum TaxID=133383 RepID=A0A1R0GTA4_9FUNG|nr:putative CDP-alcohol phosphatidyltransferase class-I family protein 3 [Smittium mucronatum]